MYNNEKKKNSWNAELETAKLPSPQPQYIPRVNQLGADN
jgi:hypothetical protein